MPSNRPASTTPEALTPSELNGRVRSLLESHFDFVWVEGEISNMARPSSGHWYFTLKDDSAQVRCAMFRGKNQRLRFSPENGDQVRLRARVSLYEGRGDFQLIGEFMEPAGAGALQAQFDALRNKLQQEGLFSADRKRELPTDVSHLAVITSPTGAALQDILQVLERRNPAIRVTVIGAMVQGEGAAGQLRDAMELANHLYLEHLESVDAQIAAKSTQEDVNADHVVDDADSEPEWDFDAIILARGGGSLEDLWAFNDEALARAIVESTLPVVTGVGHEVDFTIADFAAKQDTLQLMRDMLSVSGSGEQESNVLYDGSVAERYAALGCEIKTIPKSSAAYKKWSKYVLDNQEYKRLKVVNLYKVKRKPELAAFKSVKTKVGNTKHLFHGSSLRNWVGILSRGILMPKAVVSMGGSRTDEGWLGNGIYFSTESTTAAQYTYPGSKGTSLMAINKVALGKQKTYTKITYGITKPPRGYQSCYGISNSLNDESEFDDNEHVIYDTKQQQLDILVEFKG